MTDTSSALLATSLDGRRFGYDLSVTAVDVHPGGYVVLDVRGSGTRLGYVTSVTLNPEDGRLARVAGQVLEDVGQPFGDASARVATPGEVEEWLRAVRPSRSVLEVGMLTLADGVPLELDAGGFDRHTFLCGQSGSGKTYALGTILERLLVETSLPIVVLDPNSDFVRLAELRPDAPEVASRYAAVEPSIEVRRARAESHDRLHVRFRDFDVNERAAMLRLDPIDDREEYAALVEALEASTAAPANGRARAESVLDTVDSMVDSPDPLHSVGLRARNLGVDRWDIWSAGDPESVQDLVQPGGPRCLVVDLGSLETRAEQAIAAETVLASLWRRRAAREPVLIVLDEAHNICPATPEDRVSALATEHAARIAGEGRKFGLVLLSATQRPQKVHQNVVSQCDNLVLMRMNSRSDLTHLGETFSFVPVPILSLATDFRQGEAVIAGKLVPHPMLGRFGPRWSAEGGADVLTTWAERDV